MTGAAASLLRDLERRAAGDASVVASLIALLLVPLPAVLISHGIAASGAGLASVLAVLGALLAATPAFALPPFMVGCGIGTLAHLAVTSRARFAAIQEERHPHIGGRSLVARSLLVGGVFAAIGLVGSILLFGVA